MKKKILVILLAVSLLGIGLFAAIPALADSSNPLDHISLAPASASVIAGGTQQFTVQTFDSANAAITSNVNYFWLVTSGGGTIDNTGLFTAGSATGTYANTVQVVAVQGSITRTAFASVTVYSTIGTLNHVTITPASATVVTGGTQKFTAQGYDINDVSIAGLTYTWSVVAGGGTIDPATGLFTAGATTGTYTNTIQVSTTQGTPVNGYASVTVSAKATTNNSTKPGINFSRFFGMFNRGMFNRFFNKSGSDIFLGAQFQVASGGVTHTIVITPGVVQTASATSLTIVPNGQTSAVTYTLTSTTGINPKNAQLAAGDKVVVVTDNNEVKQVTRIATPATGNRGVPPGLGEKGQDSNGHGRMPPGWSNGNKAGWGNNTGSLND